MELPGGNRIRAVLEKPPGKGSNGLAIAAAVLTLLSLLTPGSIQILPLDSSWKTLLAMPLHLLFYSHVGGLFGLIGLASAPVALVTALFTGANEQAWTDMILCWSLLPPVIWMLLFWNWFLRAGLQLVKQFRTPVEDRRPIRFWTRRWLTAPLLAIALYGLWFTQLPLKANFALHKGTLESIADAAIAAPSGTVTFNPARSVGALKISTAHRLPRGYDGPFDWDKSEDVFDKKAREQSVTSLPIQGFWAHQGYVRDLSRQPGEIEAITFSFEQHSNNGDQEIFYLWDGWYAFQNLLD